MICAQLMLRNNDDNDTDLRSQMPRSWVVWEHPYEEIIVLNLFSK